MTRPSDDPTAALPPAPPTADNTASLGGTGPAAPADAPADRLGKYRVVGVLGRGGMGVVYRAEDPVLRRVVALKVLPARAAADPAARERFLREARAQAAVEHDHVVPIYEVVDDAAVPFLAMPVLRGMSLADALRANPTPPLSETVRIVREAAEGLAAAHATGLVHRDVKPGNIWLEEGRLRVKLLDFGLARWNDDTQPAPAVAPGSDSSLILHPSSLTAAGSILGTPAYMSPEQALGRPLDHRTDLFSLGVVLYQMLAGRLPFPGTTAADVMTAVVRVVPVPVAEVVPGLPPALADLVGRLLSKKAAARPSSAAAVATELRAVELGLTTVVDAEAERWGHLTDDAPTLTEVRPRVRRGSPWVPVTFAVLGLGVIAAAVAALMWGRTATETAFLDIDDAGAEAVELTLKRDGVPVAERTKERKFALPPGVYTVEVSAPDPAVKLSSGLVTLDRGAREQLTLRVSDRVMVARKLDDYSPDDPEWLKLFLKQPPKVQIAHFTKELKRLNPDWDEKIDIREDAGRVVGMKLTTDYLADLRPVQAMKHLTALEAFGSAPNRGRFADITPLRGLPLVYLDLMNNRVSSGYEALRTMPLRKLENFTVSGTDQLRPLAGASLRWLRVTSSQPLDAADINAALVDGADVWLDAPEIRNLPALRGRRMRQFALPRAAFADPELAVLNIEALHTPHHVDQIIANQGTIRRNPHIRSINFQSTPVFWAWHELAPRSPSGEWRVAGPFPANTETPFDPTSAGGRPPPGPFKLDDGSVRSWQVANLDRFGKIDYGALTGRAANSTAWLSTTFRADESCNTVLFVQGSQAYRAWLNGRLVLVKPETQPFGLNRAAVLTGLDAGDNTLVVQGDITEGYTQYHFGVYLHRLRPGEAPPAGIDPPAPPPKP